MERTRPQIITQVPGDGYVTHQNEFFQLAINFLTNKKSIRSDGPLLENLDH